MLLATDRRHVHAAARAAGTGFTHSSRSNDPKVSARRAGVLAEAVRGAFTVEALEKRVFLTTVVSPISSMNMSQDASLPLNTPGIPADPGLAVGPREVVLTANTQIQVYDKASRKPLLKLTQNG